MIGRAELDEIYAASEADERRDELRPMFEAAGIDFEAFEGLAGDVARGALTAWWAAGGADQRRLGAIITQVFVNGAELVLRSQAAQGS